MTTDLTSRGSSDAMVAWLAARSPAKVDEALVSLASSQNVVLAVRYRSFFPSGPNGERLPSYSVAVGCEVGGPPEANEEIVQRVERALTPAPDRLNEEWLAELDVLVPRRPNDTFTEMLRLEVYASRLAEYPADVVRDALLGRPWKFWPSWYELHQVCERLSGPRRQMLATLRRDKAEPAADTPRTRASPDAVKRILDEAGFTPKRMAAAQARPMARSETELEAEEADASPPHWTASAEPDGPEMQALREARLANPLMREGLVENAQTKADGHSVGPEASDGSRVSGLLPQAS